MRIPDGKSFHHLDENVYTKLLAKSIKYYLEFISFHNQTQIAQSIPTILSKVYKMLSLITLEANNLQDLGSNSFPTTLSKVNDILSFIILEADNLQDLGSNSFPIIYSKVQDLHFMYNFNFSR